MRYSAILTFGAALLAASVAVAQTSTTITTEQTGRVKTYIMKEKPASVRVTESIAIGSPLPGSVTLHSFPADVGVTQYRYTIVNDKALLVDPTTRRVIQVIE